MAKASLILLLILGTSCSIQAKFVKNVLPNQFEFELEERGTKFTQKIRFEEGGNLRITEVPDHNDITGATYIFDKSTGLQLDVVNATRSCFLHRPFFTLSNEDEESNLNAASNDEDEVAEYLEVKHEGTLDIELISVKGPMLHREEIPSQLAKHCFEDFEFFAMKQVQKNSHNLHHVENEDNRVLIEDPQLQKEMKFGDPLDFTDLFQVLPMRNRTTHSRVKRSCRNEHMDWTQDNCHFVTTSCSFGCASTDVFWNCEDHGSSYNCEYMLLCPRIMPSKNCLGHVRSGKHTCNPCCRNANCGSRMPQCHVN